MKKYLFLAVLGLLATHFVAAQTKDYNVVFDCTSKNVADHQAVLRWMSAIASSTPDAKLEVVLYGQSVDMVVKGRSGVADQISQLKDKKNVSIRVCAIALKHHHIDKSQLLPGVETVPDGIYEIISRQREGWGYIKVTR